MPLILPGNVASATAGAYSVANSCRFNDGDSAYMSKTSTTQTSQRKCTISCWIKRGDLGVDATIFTLGASAGSTFYSYFKSDGTLETYATTSGTAINLRTNAKYLDPAAWYNLVIAVDTEQGTAANRVKIYINGTQVTSFQTETYPAEDLDIASLTTSQTYYVGSLYGPQQYFDGYLAEFVFIDGLQLAATSFGEFDSDSPTIWKPIDVSGLTFGNNGFYLDFEASANLGNDANGGTDLGETNIAAADQATDTPTNNFATMNPLDNYYAPSTFAEGNCHITTGSSSNSYSVVTGTMGVSAGKWYWEVELDGGGDPPYAMLGITDIPTQAANQQLGYGTYQWALRQDDAILTTGSGNVDPWGVVYAVNDVIMFALDLTNNKLYFGKNGDWMQQSSGTGGDPTDGTGAISITDPASNQSGFYFPAVSDWGNGNAVLKCNFGGCSAFDVSSANADDNGYGNFEYDVPAGYLALCTKNLGSDGG